MMAALRKLCDEHGIILIADEVRAVVAVALAGAGAAVLAGGCQLLVAARW
jgi:glutamate-1-semialdehyde aminotransferase